MNKKQKNESGFGALGVVLVIFVLLAVGVAGWFVYNKNKDKNDPKTSTSNTTPSQTTHNTNSKTDPNADYLVVKEWGVRFKKDVNTQDPKYVIKDEHILYLTTETYLSKTDGACDANGKTGSVVRGKAGYKINSDSEIAIEDLSYSYKDDSGKMVDIKPAKAGEYYYWWVGPQAGCAVPTEENEKVMNTYQQALSDFAYTVELSQ